MDDQHSSTGQPRLKTLRAPHCRVLGALIVAFFMVASTLADDAHSAKRPTLAPGRIYSGVVCADQPSYHCNIYVPLSYRADRQTPVIFLFSPSGNAPVDLFRQAAERTGWLVCGSVECHNGPVNFEAIFQAMKSEMTARFNLDPHRTYFSGMSGGSRVALELLCHHGDETAGVVAISAAQGSSASEKKLPGVACVGITGHQDFNYYEFVRQAQKCEQEEWSYLMLEHPGGHGWGNAELITKACQWLDQQWTLRSDHDDAASQNARKKVIDTQLIHLNTSPPTIEAYEAAENLRQHLADAEPQAAKVDDLLSHWKAKLERELQARDALREAYTTSMDKAATAWQYTLLLQTAAREIATKFPRTLYGNRAGVLASTLELHKKNFPPNLRN